MKINIDSQDLLSIAEDIQHNCAALDNCDERDIDDLVPYHTGKIRELAEDLSSIAEKAVQHQTGE